jgi:hypothetical protein
VGAEKGEEEVRTKGDGTHPARELQHPAVCSHRRKVFVRVSLRGVRIRKG